MREEHLKERLETLEAIRRTATQSLQAISDRDLDRLNDVGGERERLFTALRAVDRALALCDGPVGDTAVGRALRERAEAILRELVSTEETVRAQLAVWHGETRDELMGMRRSRKARRAYHASEQAG